jgi:CheY-like chemotaxis protein
MQVQSIPGQGTSFTVILPLAKQQDAQQLQKQAPAAGHKLNFLIIDDEINILKMMELFFEDTEIEVITALTAEEGLRAIRQGDFDVILCDLGMDEMDGLEVGKEIKEYCHKAGISKIPFLLYTGLEKELDSEKLMDGGVDRVVKKPIPCEDLLRLIQEISAPPVQTKRTA